MAQDPKQDNVGAVLRWESFLAKEKNSNYLQKLLNNSGDSVPELARNFSAYLDEVSRKGEIPDFNEIFRVYVDVRWNKLMNIHKILMEIRQITGEVNKRYPYFQRMYQVVREQLISGKLTQIKVEPEHRLDYCKRLADQYFPTNVDNSIMGSIPISPPLKPL